MKRLTYILALALTLSVIASAETLKMQSTSFGPAAVGKIETSHDRNGNLVSEIKVEHMANPAALSPTRNVYVVWVEPPGRSPENRGVLKLNEEQAGSISVRAPYKKYDVVITAEDAPNAQSPSGPEILRGTVQDTK